jgi:hypothetical protein
MGHKGALAGGVGDGVGSARRVVVGGVRVIECAQQCATFAKSTVKSCSAWQSRNRFVTSCRPQCIYLGDLLRIGPRERQLARRHVCSCSLHTFHKTADVRPTYQS